FFTVRTDGSRLRKVTIPRILGGGHIDQTFAIAGRGRSLATFAMPGTPVNTGQSPFTQIIHELFVVDRRDFLQLTNFGREDTGGGLLDPDHRRAFFAASSDPLGTNPSQNCQLFSIDVLGSNLRQVTHFVEGERSKNGCHTGAGCHIREGFQDPVTQTLVFYST